ncbi:MAG: hypothetical protein V7676_03565 [Parasphingorhabdus sp.]|uniref:hypothetical protein n=1 Tax=Parasphingorhabdus sp. TaxID=2709688 RepID=UPI003001A188
MNVYIASFMLLLFNAVGVNAPAAAVAAETAENEIVPQIDGTISQDWENAAHALMQRENPSPVTFAANRQTNPIWSVLPIASTIGDKLEHEEGAP